MRKFDKTVECKWISNNNCKEIVRYYVFGVCVWTTTRDEHDPQNVIKVRREEIKSKLRDNPDYTPNKILRDIVNNCGSETKEGKQNMHLAMERAKMYLAYDLSELQ